MKIVIIGGSFAGMSCALEAAKLYPQADIKVIDEQERVGFIPSGLNLKLNSEIDSLTQAYFLSERDILKAGVHLLAQHRAVAIDVEMQQVEVEDVSGSRKRLEYDKLILAMGSKQSSALVAELNDERIVSTKQFHYAQVAEDIIERAYHVAVIGGGQIGIEAAEALVNANKQVSLIEANATLAARYFDKEFVADIQQAIELVGVDLHLGEAVESITTEPLCVSTAGNELYPDAIILGVNLLPNSQLVEGTVALNADGTVQVNEYLETSVPNIYAIGDLVQTPYALSGEERFIALVNNAIRSGQVVAFNLLKPRVKQAKSLRLIGSRVFSQYIVSVGMTEQEAGQQFDVLAVHQTAPYSLTDVSDVHLKLVVNRESGQLLGAQLRSEQNILGFADALALAIGQGLTDEQLAFQDRLYYPNETAAYPIMYRAALDSFARRSEGAAE